ncbi:hypothetical protein Bca52824_026721 [Brassica carinata]|uniref:Uncharacterized protein n=1 Tax=Brassica carinata TaxID=52824 RepID=A0A8X7SII3_BRACI|nr:hypothetical protein Bca52824_026721 [Brassica carinata]
MSGLEQPESHNTAVKLDCPRFERKIESPELRRSVKIASGDQKFQEQKKQLLSPLTPIVQPTTPTKHVLITTLLAVIGGGAGLVSKYRKAYPNIPTIYATNFAIVAGCYCGAREFVRITRRSEHDDVLNSTIGRLFRSALLGRLQGGPYGALRYSVIFSAMGTASNYAGHKAKAMLENYCNKDSIKLPEWFSIQILDEEALAKKKAQEQKIFAERSFGRLNKKST